MKEKKERKTPNQSHSSTANWPQEDAEYLALVLAETIVMNGIIHTEA